MTLVEFLTARLDEDEQVARDAAAESADAWLLSGEESLITPQGGFIAVGPWEGAGGHEARGHP